MLKILTRGHGATVACLTPDQQVGGSNPSVFTFFYNTFLMKYFYYNKNKGSNLYNFFAKKNFIFSKRCNNQNFNEYIKCFKINIFNKKFS